MDNQLYEAFVFSEFALKHLRTRYGWSGYGLYMGLLDAIPKYNPKGKIFVPDYGHIALDLNISVRDLREFLLWCTCEGTNILFYTDDDGFSYTSVFLEQQWQKRQRISNICSQ
jgi:hypothetical protein